METSAAVAKESAKETANAENDNARSGFLGQGGAVVSSKFSRDFPRVFSKVFFQWFSKDSQFPEGFPTVNYQGFSKGFFSGVFQGPPSWFFADSPFCRFFQGSRNGKNQPWRRVFFFQTREGS